MFDFKFDWCTEMECGIKIVDDQHRELFRIARSIEQLIMHDCHNANWKQLLDIVCELREFVAYHFYMEEDLMQKYNYSEMIKHKASHLCFKVNVIDIDITALNETPLAVLLGIRESLQDFLFNHILVEDIQLCLYLKTCGMK